MGKCQSKATSKGSVVTCDDGQCNDKVTDLLSPTDGKITSQSDVTIPRPPIDHVDHGPRGHLNVNTLTNEPRTEGTVGCTSGSTNPLDSSAHSINGRHDRKKPSLKPSSSVLGLDKMIRDRSSTGDFMRNMVHMEVPFGKPIEEVYDGVHDGTVLGSGISGIVRLCCHKATGVQYAVKSLDLGLVETEEGLQQLREEIAIMCQLDHPNIVRLEEVYESHSEIYLVQELCVGGELFDRLDEQPDYHYSEAQCAALVKQMICSVRYIHSKGIIHRDLKLENFLFSTKDPNSELKMIDFGLSKHFKFGQVHHEPVGTPYTVSPEVISGSYDERCDVWAIGVITFLLLSGESPFGGCGGPESLMQVRANILTGHFVFQPEDAWANVSEQAKQFIRALLVIDPNSRPTAQKCQEDAWLHKWTNKDKNDDGHILSPHVMKALVNFKEYSDMRKLLCEVLSFTLLPEQITDLRKEFEKLDTEGSGEISLDGLKDVMLQNAGTGSLGALTEKEVEDIFNAMRVSKTETRIHWHEFIAAGLSQCHVDDRNLKLAFERLDHDHKGYVTFDDVMNLMGKDGAENEDTMKIMWGDSMRFCNSKNAQITYTDFLRLMKGQPNRRYSHSDDLQVLQEGISLDETKRSDGEGVSHDGSSYAAPLCCGSDMTPAISDKIEGLKTIEKLPCSPTVSSSVSGMPPFDLENMSDVSDGPLTMDDEDMDEAISKHADIAMQNKISPRSPVVVTSSLAGNVPLMSDFKTKEHISTITISPKLKRHRSKSVDDQEINQKDENDEVDVTPFICCPIPISGQAHNEIGSVIHDETKTPLVVNRKLYRAHRQMRLAVLDACKRFEDKQLKRTKAELLAESDLRFAPGLVMRRGHTKELSSGAIRKMMKDKQKKQEQMVNVAHRLSGRGRRTRKKTTSDMSGMFSSASPSNDFSPSLPTIPSSPPIVNPTVIPTSNMAQDNLQPHLHDMSYREPTIPGVFRNTSDPFRQMNTLFMDLVGTSAINSSNMGSVGEESSLENSNANSASRLKLSVSDGELNQHIIITPRSPEQREGNSSKSPRSASMGMTPSCPPPPLV